MSESINVLIVDDNKNNLLSLRALIKKHFKDVNVIEANSGLTALSLLMKQTVDLIILDIQMPQMDGFETAKIIQARPKTQDIPIVFLTAAYKSEEFQNKGYALGAADYLTKPIVPQELTSKLRLYLRFVRHKSQQSFKNELEVEQAVAEQGTAKGLSDNSLKQTLIADLFHELQTSLNTMIGCSAKLEKEASNLNHNDCLPDIQKINREGKQLLDLINNVLEPKMKGGKVQVQQ